MQLNGFTIGIIVNLLIVLVALLFHIFRSKDLHVLRLFSIIIPDVSEKTRHVMKILFIISFIILCMLPYIMAVIVILSCYTDNRE
jgi:hypothetical protein